jgi:hypothetical protein
MMLRRRYSNAPTVRLYVNGKAVATPTGGPATTVAVGYYGVAIFRQVVWEPGNLSEPGVSNLEVGPF